MDISRQEILSLVGFAVGGGLLSRLLKGMKEGSTGLLRPPGAQPEADFLAACIRCGQCVEACPYDTLHLCDIDDLVAVGTPYLVPSQTPCRLCQGYETLKCIAACPSGALEPVAHISEIRMGTAVIDPSTCLAWQGTPCRACWHACPLPDQAILLEIDFGRPEVTEACIGCGLCVHACLTAPASITVRPV